MTKELLHQIINQQVYFPLFLIVVTGIALNFVNLKLIFKMLGVEVGFRKMLFEVLVMACYCLVGRLLLSQLAFTLILLGLLVLILRIVNGIPLIRAFWCSFLAFIFINIGTLFLSTLCIVNKNINSFMFTPLGYAVGTVQEMLGPLIVLFILSKFKISLVPPFRKRLTLIESVKVLLFGVILFISCCTFAQMWPQIKSGSIHKLDSLIVLPWAGTIATGLMAYLLNNLTQKEHDNQQRAHEEERTRTANLLQELLDINNEKVADSVANKLKVGGDLPVISEDSDSQVQLTPIEYVVLKLIAQGLTNKQIGAEIGENEDKIKRIVTALNKKLGYCDRVELGLYAALNGLLTKEELSKYRKEKEEE